ncbi:Rhamnogalacturonyl hydrolase YesR [Alteromonadaceae bacterium Bs31]|nr:Rhamnogalacturonyl hydrolase YesR [Alteromonadaceae bacterium Bs31]
MRYLKTFLFTVSVLGLSLPTLADKETSSRIPQYPVSYDYPKATEIKNALDRVRDYYQSTSTRQIVDKRTGKAITDLSKANKFAIPSEGLANEWSYTHGVVLSAFVYIEQLTGDKNYVSNNVQFFDFVIASLPYFETQIETFGYKGKIPNWGRILNFHALDDCGSIGAALIKTYQGNKNEQYLPLIERINEHVSSNQFRLKDGTLARHRPQYESIWADDLYMSVPFLANMGAHTGESKYFDDAAKQILQMADRLYIPEKELFDHGWSVSSGDYDPRFYWARANGWTLMAMAELLELMPKDHPKREAILHLYRSLVRSLANLQDGTGFWHNLLDKPNTFTETSATAMFTFAIAKGINEGWINHVYGPVAVTGWNAINTRILESGAVDGTVEGTTFAHDNSYYFYRGRSIHATHGYGPVLYAGAEMIRLLNNEKLVVQKAVPGKQNSTHHFLLKSEWPAEKNK